MSDPKLSDPLQQASIDPNDPRPGNDYLVDAQSTPPDDRSNLWGWVAGVAIVALIAAVMLSGNADNSQMANDGSGVVPGVTSSTQSPPSDADTQVAPSSRGSSETTGSGASKPE